MRHRLNRSGDRQLNRVSLLRRVGPVTPGRISRWTAMPVPTMSATVRRLVQRGHVEHNAPTRPTDDHGWWP